MWPHQLIWPIVNMVYIEYKKRDKAAYHSCTYSVILSSKTLKFSQTYIIEQGIRLADYNFVYL